MVEFRILGYKVSSMSREECHEALKRLKELEGKLIKRANSFQGEFLEVIKDKPELIKDKKIAPE